MPQCHPEEKTRGQMVPGLMSPSSASKLGFRIPFYWWDLCVPKSIRIAAGDSYLIDRGMTEVLGPCARGTFLRSRTSVVAPATLHEGWGREALAAGLEVLTAQALQRDLGDLQRKATDRASRKCAGLFNENEHTHNFTEPARDNTYVCKSRNNDCVMRVTEIKFFSSLSCRHVCDRSYHYVQ